MGSRQIGMISLTFYSTAAINRIDKYRRKGERFCSADSFRFQRNLSSAEYWKNDTHLSLARCSIFIPHTCSNLFHAPPGPHCPLDPITLK